MAQKDRAEVRRAVHKRIRRKVKGSAARPRLTIYRSLNHIYVQIIDDEQGRTIASASTTEKDLRGETGGNIDAAVRVGRAIAERALTAGSSRSSLIAGLSLSRARQGSGRRCARGRIEQGRIEQGAAEAAPEEQSAQAG
jgi:large subunit ribosomal protein L18